MRQAERYEVTIPECRSEGNAKLKFLSERNAMLKFLSERNAKLKFLRAGKGLKTGAARLRRKRRLTVEQRTYRQLEALADAVTSGQVDGEFVEVKGNSRAELYEEFFG